MTWPSPGSQRLPPHWKHLRALTFHRDHHRCTWPLPQGGRCPATTQLECDHIGDKNDHRLANLRTLCRDHHRERTAAQAAAARPTRQRPRAKHPGILDA